MSQMAFLVFLAFCLISVVVSYPKMGNMHMGFGKRGAIYAFQPATSDAINGHLGASPKRALRTLHMGLGKRSAEEVGDYEEEEDQAYKVGHKRVAPGRFVMGLGKRFDAVPEIYFAPL